MLPGQFFSMSCSTRGDCRYRPFRPLLMAAALSAQHPDHLAAVLAAGLGGAVIGDSLQYWCGRHFGRRILALLCKVSVSPDFCVSQTEALLARVGPLSLLFAKFLPGISLLSVAMAGITR